MDPMTLRIILLAAGVLLLVAIYYWDRIVENVKNPRGAVKRRREVQQPHREPGEIGKTQGNEPWTGKDEPRDIDFELASLGQIVRESQERAEGTGTAAPSAAAAPEHLAAPSTRSSDKSPEMKAAGSGTELPSMILQISLANREELFRGPDIQRAAERVGLEYGEYRIFHRYVVNAGRKEILFNVASMVQPGVIPIDDLENFTTPGITFFAQLPGPQDGLMIFSEMLSTAERMAAELGGELQDETHSALNRQTVEYIKTQLQEFRRRLQLARMKQ